jgi:hypothetical protein
MSHDEIDEEGRGRDWVENQVLQLMAAWHVPSVQIEWATEGGPKLLIVTQGRGRRIVVEIALSDLEDIHSTEEVHQKVGAQLRRELAPAMEWTKG